MHKIRLMCLLLASLLLALPARAQSDASPINYCASTLSYDLPDGWVAGDAIRNQYGAAQRFANGEAALMSAELVGDERVIIVNLVDRGFMLPPMGLDADAGMLPILENVAAQASSEFTVGSVTPITLGDQPAARVDVHAATGDMLMFALDLDGETIGLVTLSTPPGGIDAFEPLARQFADSLSLDAQRFAADAPLAHSYASEDCVIAFAYPDDLSLVVPTQLQGVFYYVTLENFAGDPSDSPYALQAGQMRLDISILIGSSGDEAAAIPPGVQVVSEEDATINGYPARITHLHGDGSAEAAAGESLKISIRHPVASIVLTLYTAPGELDQWRDTALAVAQTLQVNLPSSE